MEGCHSDFAYKNILPIPHLLSKILIQLDSTTPYQVAKAFMSNILEQTGPDPLLETSFDSFKISSGEEAQDDEIEEDSPEDNKKSSNKTQTARSFSKDELLYAVQFCHLCAGGKIPPVLYSLSQDKDVSLWFKQLLPLTDKPKTPNKRRNPATPESDSDSTIYSPNNKISKKDHYFINTIKKLHDTMDKSSKSKEEKEPGFKRLEAHRKTLILNASAIPPYTMQPKNPLNSMLPSSPRRASSRRRICCYIDSKVTRSLSIQTPPLSQTSGIANFSGYFPIPHQELAFSTARRQNLLIHRSWNENEI